MSKILEVDLSGLDKLVKQFNPEIVERGINQAFNTIGSRARVAGVKKVTEVYNVKNRTVTRNVSVRKSSRFSLKYTITVKGKGINLGSLPGTAMDKHGVNYRILRKGPRKNLAHAFLVNTSNVDAGVKGIPRKRKRKGSVIWNRIVKKRRKLSKGPKLAFMRIGDNNYPLRGQSLFSPVEMFNDEGLEAVEKVIDDDLFNEIERNIIRLQDAIK